MSNTPSVSMDKKWMGSAPIDGKSPIHFLVGVVAGMSGINASWATVIVVGFEAFLVTLEEGRLDAAFEKRSPQSYGNAAVDTMLGIAGVYYGEYLRKQQNVKSMLVPDHLLAQKSPTNNAQADTAKLIAASNGGGTVDTQFPETNVQPITEVSGVPFYR